jgi:hypothetical protein
MLCSVEGATISQLGDKIATPCSQGIVLAGDLNNAASKLEKATQASDIAYLYMFDNQEAKHVAAEIAHKAYFEATDEWAKHTVFCKGCRGTS